MNKLLLSTATTMLLAGATISTAFAQVSVGTTANTGASVGGIQSSGVSGSSTTGASVNGAGIRTGLGVNTGVDLNGSGIAVPNNEVRPGANPGYNTTGTTDINAGIGGGLRSSTTRTVEDARTGATRTINRSVNGTRAATTDTITAPSGSVSTTTTGTVGR